MEVGAHRVSHVLRTMSKTYAPEEMLFALSTCLLWLNAIQQLKRNCMSGLRWCIYPLPWPNNLRGAMDLFWSLSQDSSMLPGPPALGQNIADSKDALWRKLVFSLLYHFALLLEERLCITWTGLSSLELQIPLLLSSKFWDWHVLPGLTDGSEFSIHVGQEIER